MSRGEWAVMTLFVLTVAAWAFRANTVVGPLTISGWSTWLGLEVHDGTVAVAAEMLLFLIPVNRKSGQFTLDWVWAVRIPWEVLLLFGVGFALADAFHLTSLGAWLVTQLGVLAALPLGLMMLVLCVVVAFASGYVTAPQMVRAGLVLDLLGALLVTLAVTALGRLVFGLW